MPLSFHVLILQNRDFNVYVPKPYSLSEAFINVYFVVWLSHSSKIICISCIMKHNCSLSLNSSKSEYKISFETVCAGFALCT